MIEKIATDKAPAAVGPYSQAIVAHGFAFLSGQIPLNPLTMKVEATTVREQTKVVLSNLKAVLEASGASQQSVVRATVYLKDMNDYAVVNEEYEKFFKEHKPARVCIEVARLPKDVLVEIDAIAVV